MNKLIRKEPLIRVGIILPEDNRTSIMIQIPGHSKYAVNGNIVSGRLKIESRDYALLINGQQQPEFLVSPNDDKTDEYIIIEQVPAGRGFHWQKDIKTKLSGNLEIYSRNGFLFVVNELPVEKYLPFVATAEMNPQCPIALLEAQTISARSWLLAKTENKHADLNIDVCNDDCCQRYQGVVDIPDRSFSAINGTSGKVLIYNNEICDARYSKCCGGITESYENAWGGDHIPYLSSIPDFPPLAISNYMIDNLERYFQTSPPAYCSPDFVKPEEFQKYLGKVDTTDSYYRWDLEYSQAELTVIINTKLKLEIQAVRNLKSLERSNSGRIIKLKIDFIDKFDRENSIIINSEYDIRNALHRQFLYSSAFIIDQNSKNSTPPKLFKLTGAGWGHGVGLCQIGALGMALDGQSAERILGHYFKNTNIDKLY